MEEYLNELCPRCGSKRIIAKVWKEKLKTFSGTVDVEHTKIVCTNKPCQKAFEAQRALEAKKREEERVKKEEREAARKKQKAATKTTSVKKNK